MSEEDAELKDVLVRSLNENGILPRLQAQLRAAVFVALEKHNFGESLKPSNEVFRSFVRTEDGLLVASIIVDFLAQMNLSNTLEVLKSEAELDQSLLLDSEKISSELGGAPLEKGKPLIAQLVSGYRTSGFQRSGKSCTERQSTSNDLSQPTLNGPSDNKSLNHSHEKELVEKRKLLAAEVVPNGRASSASDPSIHPTANSGAESQLNGGSQVVTVEKGPNGDQERCTPCSQQQTVNSSQEKSSFSSSDRVDHQTYQDDFTSPRSLKTPDTLHSDTTGTSLPLGSDATGSQLVVPPPQAASASPRASAKSQSVIRVYVRNRRSRRRQDNELEVSSDIDDDAGDDCEIIEECLSVTLSPSASQSAKLSQQLHSPARSDDEITLDDTIDSEASFIVDHVEDIQPTSTTTMARKAHAGRPDR